MKKNVSIRCPRIDYDINSPDTKERDANYFAAELLMPTNVLKYFIFEEGITDPVRLAEIFGVSTKALQIKLETAGLIKKRRYKW